MGYIRGDATEEDSDMALQGAVAWGVFCHLLARNAGKVTQSTGMGSAHTLEFRSCAVHVDFDLLLSAFEARGAGAATDTGQPNAPAQYNATLPEEDVKRSPWAPHWVVYAQAPQHVAEAEAEVDAEDDERAVTLLFDFGRGRVRSSWGGADVAKPAPPQSAADTLWRGRSGASARRRRCGAGVDKGKRPPWGRGWNTSSR